MRRSVASVTIWLVLSVVAAVIVVRAHYTGDLTAFLPHAPSPAQQLLVDELREGPASKLILLAIEGADAPTRARLSRTLAQSLRSDGLFHSIANGDAAASERDQQFIFAHRYLLSAQVDPERFTVAGLRSAIGDSIDMLSSTVGSFTKDLFVHDPTGETLAILAQLNQSAHARTEGGVWVSRDRQRAVLVAETRASGADIDGQERAIQAIERSFAVAQRGTAGAKGRLARLVMSGPPVFAVRARSTIEHEAVRLSELSALLIALLLLSVYRSVPALLLTLLPVLTGVLFGVAAVALAFGVVHGVTLGFGVALIGEAVDYSVYYFIQANHGLGSEAERSANRRTLWRTIRLGVLTSAFGFASLLPSRFPGLSQLGVYSIAGLISAALVTRFVLPALVRHDIAVTTAAPIGRAFLRMVTPLRRVRAALWILSVLAGAVVFLAHDRLWNRDLSALSPVTTADQVLDAGLRADLGAPDVRTLVVLTAPSAEAALRESELASTTLASLKSAGTIGGFESPSRYLPSLATQAFRRASLPSRPELRARLAAAVASLPVRVARLRPFVADVAAARHGPLLVPGDLAGTSLAAGVDSLLLRRAARWYAVLPLQAPAAGPSAPGIDVARVKDALRNTPLRGGSAVVLDLKRASDALYASYLTEAVRLSIGGLAAILVLLCVSLRSVARVVRVITPLFLAVLTVMAGFVLDHHRLTILHLIGLVLIVAIGSNYALFFDRTSRDISAEVETRKLASLLIANATAVIGFGVLATSAVPVLAALGETVAPGVLLALLFSALLAKSLPIPSRSR